MHSYIHYLVINPENFNPKILYVMSQDIITETQTYPPQGHMTILYLLQGKCTYIVNGKKYNAKAGDVIFVNPDDSHKKIPQNGDQIIEFSMGMYEFSLFDLPPSFFISPYMDKIITLGDLKNEFNKSCNDVFNSSKSSRSFSSVLTRAEAYKIIGYLLKELYSYDTLSFIPKKHFVSSDRKSITNTIIRYLDENYMNDISLETISKNMFLSSIYISKMFKEETGESPINHLIRIRIRTAKTLLETTNFSIRTIATRVGYSDPFYFSKLFKKYYGMSPSHVRMLSQQ